MCQTFGVHWGYAKNDLCYKAPADIIRDLVACRRYGSNLLLNVGPKGDGTIRKIDEAIYEMVGQWVAINGEAIYEPFPTGIEIENKPDDFILVKDNTYYLFCDKIPMFCDANQSLLSGDTLYQDAFAFDKKIKKVTWLDNGAEVPFEQEGGRVVIKTEPYTCGYNLVVRVAKIETEAE